MTKQLARFGAAVMTTLLALVVLWQFRMVVVYVLISLTLAAAHLDNAALKAVKCAHFISASALPLQKNNKAVLTFRFDLVD